MKIATPAIDSVLLFGITCASVCGATRLPTGAQVPMHFGPGGYTNWVSRNVGLLLWPVIGVAA